MVVAMVMALMVRMIRGHLFNGGRHLHGYTKMCQPVDENSIARFIVRMWEHIDGEA